MKAGTIIRLPDGRDGTVVYHGLDGYGIRFGRHAVDAEALLAANAVKKAEGDDAEWLPEAMLRKPSQYSARLWPGMECVGDEYEVIP